MFGIYAVTEKSMLLSDIFFVKWRIDLHVMKNKTAFSVFVRFQYYWATFESVTAWIPNMLFFRPTPIKKTKTKQFSQWKCFFPDYWIISCDYQVIHNIWPIILNNCFKKIMMEIFKTLFFCPWENRVHILKCILLVAFMIVDMIMVCDKDVWPIGAIKKNLHQSIFLDDLKNCISMEWDQSF